MRGATSADFETDIARAVNGDPCYELAFFTQSDSLSKELIQSAGPTLNTFEVGGYLEYWGLSKTDAIDVPIKGAGMVRQCAFKK